VNDACRFFDLIFLHSDRDFDLGGGDHPNVDARFAHRCEHFCGNSGMAAHANADTGKLGNTGLSFNYGLSAQVGKGQA
jgi:hypothetical protein